MSAFVKLETEFSDQACLVSALQELGYVVEVHDKPQVLMDWAGRPTEKRAHVIVRNKHLRGMVNDLGFEKDGKVYSAHFSVENSDLKTNVTQMYALHKVKKQAKKNRWKVKIPNDIKPGEKIKLKLTAWK